MAYDTSKKLTHFIEDQIPDYVQEFYPLFVIFTTKYFEYLENTSNGVQYTIQNLQLNRDIDTTASSLAIKFLNTYCPNLPDISAVDDSILVKYFRQYFQLKGSEKSFKFFFKAFFNDDITVTYPRDQLFKTSDNTWYTEKSIRVNKNSGDPLNLTHTVVTGLTSTASAIIDKVIKVSGVGGLTYYDLVLQPGTINGTFQSSETIRGIYYNFTANTSSFVTVTSLTNLTTADGKFLNEKSILSTNQVLQDSYYYQQFSYVIRTSEDRETWAVHVLDHLHPAGSILFNEYKDDEIANNDTSFVQTIKVETSVRIPTIKTYLTAPTFTFDRTADLQTGTSTTQIATTTGFATVAYTSIGAISYNAAFDYPGEHVTWALQSVIDVFSSVTEIVRPDGATFDKLSRAVDLDQQLIAWSYDTNSSLVTTRYAINSSVTASNQVLSNVTSGTLRYKIPLASINSTSVGSMVLLLTYVKNSRGNQTGEEDNTISLKISSNATILPYFDEEVQRNYKRVSLNNSLGINNLVYYHSSNSVQAYSQTPGYVQTTLNSQVVTGVSTTFGTTFRVGDYVEIGEHTSSYIITEIFNNTSMLVTPAVLETNTSSILYKVRVSGTPLSSIAYIANNEGQFLFKPFNGQRGQTYDRLAMRIEMAPTEQRNTSLLERFSTVNITSSGLIASWSSLSTSVSATSFTSNTSTVFIFNSNSFVFNGVAGQSRHVTTTSFLNSERVDVTLDYLVGDGYNGGEVPDASEDLELQYSINGGSSWFTAHKIWVGSTSNAWTYGSRVLSGRLWTTVGSNTINGNNTIFGTQLAVGDRILLNTSINTTAYTITSIVGNTQLNVTPAVVDLFRSSVLVTGLIYGPDTLVSTSSSRLYGILTGFTTSLARDAVISLGSSTTTSYTVINVIDDETIDVTPVLTQNLYTSTTLTGKVNIVAGTTSLVGIGGASSTVFLTQLSTGDVIRVENNNIQLTSYTVINVINNTSVLVTPPFVETSSNINVFKTTGVGIYLQNSGVLGYEIVPAGEQFQTTSVTVYGPGPSTSVIVRVIQNSATTLNEDVYAIDNLKVDSYRYQASTGVVNISVTVSSGTTLYVNDTDYIDITTIGTL